MRSFIAINLPRTVKDEIDAISNRLRPAAPPARWVAGENMHLTMKFLDEIDETRVAPICSAIEGVVRNVKPIGIRLGGFGIFPNEKKARTFWVGIESGHEILKTLVHDIDCAIELLGFEREQRPFSAHITLARMREPSPADQLMRAAATTAYQSEEILIQRIELMKSVLSPKGPTYSIIKSISLAQTGSP